MVYSFFEMYIKYKLKKEALPLPYNLPILLKLYVSYKPDTNYIVKILNQLFDFILPQFRTNTQLFSSMPIKVDQW